MDKKVVVLYGGTSSEREVSLHSGANVAEYLTDAGYTVELADTGGPDFDLLGVCENAGAVLPILHGAGGEDGVLQRELERLHVSFFGSGSEACALTFNKGRYREFIEGHGIKMAAGEVVDRKQFRVSTLRQAPYVLKPLNGGSSVDTIILHDLAKEPSDAFFDDMFVRYEHMLLEVLIVGQEITVGILNDKALPIILIVPPEGKDFDYENKYNGQTAEIVNPEQVPIGVQKQAQELALQLHLLTGCRHLSRSDMIVTTTGSLYVLETNTIPGMTAQSLFPKMAAADGMDMVALVKCFVEMAKEL
jgi:D-alanine-D-alanine ligase